LLTVLQLVLHPFQQVQHQSTENRQPLIILVTFERL
jgi:hypothetical protein